MIFLRYESFRSYLKQFPVTSAIIALNIIYFVVVALSGDPGDGYHAIEFGAFVTHVTYDPFGLIEPWRYLTSIFMHAGLEHILYNMFALLVFAPPLERVLKPWRYTFFYLVCGIMGNAVSAAYHVLTGDPNIHVGVGASGAIYGVFGAYLFISLFRKTQLDVASRKTVYMILIAGVIYSLIVPKVDLWAHIGGALAGFLIYQIFDRTRTWRQKRRI